MQLVKTKSTPTLKATKGSTILNSKQKLK